MVRSRTYEIQGDPRPLQSRRFSKGHVFNSQKQLMLIVGIDLARQHADEPPFEGPLHVDVTFYMKLPDIGKKKLPQFYRRPVIIRPDLSNCLKLIEDCASNGVIYKDDCIIASIHCRKLYADEHGPRTVFT